jgi:hypothetical protein
MGVGGVIWWMRHGISARANTDVGRVTVRVAFTAHSAKLVLKKKLAGTE